MSEVEQRNRADSGLGEDYGHRAGRNYHGLSDFDRHSNGREEHHELKPRQAVTDASPLPVGAPLPMGSSGRSPFPPVHAHGRPGTPPGGRALSAPAAPAELEHNSGMQWALGVMKQAVPFVQRLLPLLDGQIATVVANLLAARPHTPPSAPNVDLQPLEHGLADLQIQQRDLKDQFVEQNHSLKRVEDQLEMVREATDRNTLEQQELIEGLKTMGNRVNLLALLFLGLLVISVLLNIFLFLHIQRVLR
jgi:hypothetical protein